MNFEFKVWGSNTYEVEWNRKREHSYMFHRCYFYDLAIFLFRLCLEGLVLPLPGISLYNENMSWSVFPKYYLFRVLKCSLIFSYTRKFMQFSYWFVIRSLLLDAGVICVPSRRKQFIALYFAKSSLVSATVVLDVLE